MLKRNVSISLRLTLWFGAIFFLGWVLFGASMWLNLKNTLKGERRQTLGRRLDRLQELLDENRAQSPEDRAQAFASFARATGNGLSEIFRPDGTRAFPSPSPAAASFPWPKLAPANAERFVNVRSGDQPYWVLARNFTLEGQPLILAAAAPEAGNLLVLQSFLRGLLASVPVLLLLSSAAGYWVSRRALQPVDRIAAAARSITIRNISERLPVVETGDELQRLAETCNAMLERLEASVNQIKRFTADASHELRGPLSFVRTVAEIALQDAADSTPDSRRALEDIVAEASRASLLLEEMLTLARADAAPLRAPLVELDLSQIVAEVLDMARPIAERQQIRLIAPPANTPSIQILADAPSLRRLLWILVDNALKYTLPGATVEVLVTLAEGHPTVAVRDTGIGIAPADLPRIFDRFYRADPSRGLVEGSGLGLAIGKWIAENHRATLSATSEPGLGTTFRLTFPSPQ
jgi:heavy metal sensor kinase